MDRTIHLLYIIEPKKPWRIIRCKPCLIIVGKKRVWASPLLFCDKRHLIGSSAFYTKAAAERSRLSYLNRIKDSRFVAYRWPTAYHAAEDALRKMGKNENTCS